MQRTFEIYHDLYIKASAKEVFDGVSDPEHLNNWWTLKCKGTPELGAAYHLYFAPEYDWLGEVTVVNHHSSFHIKMTRSITDWDATTFGFDIEEWKEGVKLKFSHLGWQYCNDEFRNSSFCWALLLQGLKNYLEQGTIIPFEDRA